MGRCSPSSFVTAAGLLVPPAILRPAQYQPVFRKIMRGLRACFDRLGNTMERTPWTSTA